MYVKIVIKRLWLMKNIIFINVVIVEIIAILLKLKQLGHANNFMMK
jgi:hypothetical protein